MIVDIRRPKTVREALRERSVPGAAYLGGGTWLNARRNGDRVILVSLEALGLDSISRVDGACTIGAAATFQQIADAKGVPGAVRDAVLLTPSRTLRNMVTLGGELGLFPEDSALIPALMAHDATVSVAGQKQAVPVAELEELPPETLILSVKVPNGGRRCIVKAVSRTAGSPRSFVTAVSVRANGAKPKDVHVVVSDCGGQRLRLESVEVALEGRTLPDKDDIEEMVAIAFAPRPDIHASADYKRYIAGVLVADALYALVAGKESA
jgi:putative selenate reductase FAD-binding subunit